MPRKEHYSVELQKAEMKQAIADLFPEPIQFDTRDGLYVQKERAHLMSTSQRGPDIVVAIGANRSILSPEDFRNLLSTFPIEFVLHHNVQGNHFLQSAHESYMRRGTLVFRDVVPGPALLTYNLLASW